MQKAAAAAGGVIFLKKSDRNCDDDQGSRKEGIKEGTDETTNTQIRRL
jgi:hypothetical protein